jgi:hypothetical protein
MARVGSLRALPEPIHPIAIEDTVDANEGHLVNQTLRDKQTIKWIAMMKRRGIPHWLIPQ